MWFGFSLLTANGDQPSKFCPKAGMLPSKPPRQCVSMHVIPRNRETGLKINLVEQALIVHLRLYELWALQPYSRIGIWLLLQRKWCPGVTCSEALPGQSWWHTECVKAQLGAKGQPAPQSHFVLGMFELGLMCCGACNTKVLWGERKGTVSDTPFLI